MSHRNPRHQRLFISCSKSSTSISGKCACPSRGTQNDTRESVTEILLKLPETEAFDGMPEATVRLFQASIARFSNQSEAKLIVQALGNWRSALSRGTLPASESWPPEPLGSELQNAMNDLDFLSLISKSPELIDSVLLNSLDAAQRLSQSESIASQQQDKDDTDGKDQNGFGLQMPSFSTDFLNSNSGVDLTGDGSARLDLQTEPSRAQGKTKPLEEPALVDMNETEMEMQSDMREGDSAMFSEQFQDEAQPGEQSVQSTLAREFNKFLKKMKAEAAEAAEGSEGSEGSTGERPLRSWRELAEFEKFEKSKTSGTSGTSDFSYFALYRRLLGRLPELRTLIRKMGRKAGLGSLRFQEAQREDSKEGDGIIRSPQMPAETSGITRSDGSLLLLPSELSLLAYANAKPPRSNSAGARALHQLRRAEASLLSYERSAWLEEKAKSLRSREFRPGFEKGPLICCVDTSRSMAGKEEAVAKAAVLEVLRLAETERRRCHLFFFSGPNQLEELEIPAPPIPAAAWQGVLDFLGRSFQGKTDLDAPLAASIQRVQSTYESKESVWQTADILFVTDSKVEEPSPRLVEKLQSLRDHGLRTFALIVLQETSSSGMKVMDEICDEVKHFEALGRISFGFGKRAWFQCLPR